MQRFVVAALLCLVAAQPAVAAVSVETYTATVTIELQLPGTPNGSGGLNFGGSGAINSVDFAPGAVTFQGQPVDFDGTEPQFLAPAYNESVRFPVATGPATVNPGFDCGGGPQSSPWSGAVESVQLRAAFGAANLDLGPGGPLPFSMSTRDWTSTIATPLNDYQVQVVGSCTITSVDVINGIVTLTSSGSILGGERAVPALSDGALLLLATGLMGIGIAVWRRRVAISGRV